MPMPVRSAVVTGANKGIGLAIVRALALRYPTSALHAVTPGAPLNIYLTARSRSRGVAAVESLLHADEALHAARVLRKDGGLVTIEFAHLDVLPTERSMTDFAAQLKDRFASQSGAGLDILVNNAGITSHVKTSPEAYAEIAQIFDINYWGLLATTNALLPLMRRSTSTPTAVAFGKQQTTHFTSRIVNMASLTGKLNKYSTKLTREFRTTRTVPLANAMMRGFLDALSKGTWKDDGWPDSPYAVSKAGVIALTRALADDQREGILINCCCPGYVKTDLTKGRGRKSPNEGAATPVMLALDDLHGTTGGFYTNGEVIDW